MNFSINCRPRMESTGGSVLAEVRFAVAAISKNMEMPDLIFISVGSVGEWSD